LAAAAHLRHANVETTVFGKVMDFWERHMPEGMFLRSSPRASNIADPERACTLLRYEREQGVGLTNPLSLQEFRQYAQWFQRRLVPEVDARAVTRVEHEDGGFRLILDDDAAVNARRVAVAAGIAPFAWRPPQFDGLPANLVSHSLDERDLSRFSGSRVLVLGAGQSALESAALLHESGADVELVMRAPKMILIPDPQPARGLIKRQVRRAMYPPTEVGPPGLSWIAAMPDAFRPLPRRVQVEIDRRATWPMGAAWLRPRLRDVRMTTRRSIVSATASGNRVHLKLDDGGTREIDHVLLGTGYRVEISRYPFLPPELLQSVRTVAGYPKLTSGLESSVPGLHFLGAPAAASFGPVMRFVAGTPYAAQALARKLSGKPALPLSPSF
jgi:cation diffusion facilitator CzcD-associated flavoprotein CzcO